MGWNYNTACDLLYCRYDTANLMYEFIMKQELIKSYGVAIQKFRDLTNETSAALKETKSFTKSGRIAGIREKLESQSAAIIYERNQ